MSQDCIQVYFNFKRTKERTKRDVDVQEGSISEGDVPDPDMSHVSRTRRRVTSPDRAPLVTYYFHDDEPDENRITLPAALLAELSEYTEVGGARPVSTVVLTYQGAEGAARDSISRRFQHVTGTTAGHTCPVRHVTGATTCVPRKQTRCSRDNRVREDDPESTRRCYSSFRGRMMAKRPTPVHLAELDKPQSAHTNRTHSHHRKLQSAKSESSSSQSSSHSGTRVTMSTHMPLGPWIPRTSDHVGIIGAEVIRVPSREVVKLPPVTGSSCVLH